MRYPDYVRIGRQTGSTVNDSGDVTPTIAVLYEGPADVQDEGAIVSRRAQTSEAVRASDATVFLPVYAPMEDIRAGDFVLVAWGSADPPDDDDNVANWDADARVVRAVRVDQKVFVRDL